MISRYKRYTTATIVLLALSVVACSDTAEEILEDLEDLTTEEPEVGGPVGAPDPSAPTLSAGSELPLMISLAECGSIPIADIDFSNVEGSPGQMLLGEVFEGLVDPASATNQTNYWTIDLPAGDYGLVLESNTLGRFASNIGLDATASVAGQDPVFLGGRNDIEWRSRSYFRFTTVRDATVNFEISPGFGAEDYRLGVFANGTPVPSPWFADCPEFETLAVGDTKSFDFLPVGEAGEGIVWYEMDLAVGRYDVTFTMNYPGGFSSNILGGVKTYDQYAQWDRDQGVIGLNLIDSMFSTEGEITVTEPAKYWMRIFNSHFESGVGTITLVEE